MKRNKGRRKTWSFFLDLKSAFDSVDHDTVFKKMKDKMNIPENLIATIRWLYKQTRFSVGKKEIPIGTVVI